MGLLGGVYCLKQTISELCGNYFTFCPYPQQNTRTFKQFSSEILNCLDCKQWVEKLPNFKILKCSRYILLAVCHYPPTGPQKGWKVIEGKSWMALKEPLINHQMTIKQPSKSVMPNHIWIAVNTNCHNNAIMFTFVN